MEERRIIKLPDYLDEDGILTCPKCGCQDFEVTHSYKWLDGKKPRRRACTYCGWKITTSEKVDETD
jgi:transcriptional regulator NrdR family protein